MKGPGLGRVRCPKTGREMQTFSKWDGETLIRFNGVMENMRQEKRQGDRGPAVDRHGSTAGFCLLPLEPDLALISLQNYPFITKFHFLAAFHCLFQDTVLVRFWKASHFFSQYPLYALYSTPLLSISCHTHRLGYSPLGEGSHLLS